MEQDLHKVIEKVRKELEFEPVDFTVEHPTEREHGDYATNVALLCAKQKGQKPQQIAKQFKSALLNRNKNIERVEVAEPGFINFYLSRDFFKEKTKEILKEGDDWCKNKGFKGERIMLEYTSPNLFKPLHVGNLVGNIIGESLARLFEFGGAKVYRINYPSDIGLSVAKAIWGLKKAGKDATDIHEIGVAYRTGNEAYDSDDYAKKEIETINRALYTDDDVELTKLRNEGIQTSRMHLAELCGRLGTVFDADIPESEAGTRGAEVVKKHIGTTFEESERAVVFRGDKHGLHTRVFINSQGLPTYEAKDLGNFALKQEKFPDWTRSYIITGNEQTEYFKVVITALRAVFPETREKIMGHIATGFLTLTSGKMSARKGNVLTAETVLKEVKEAAQTRAQESRADDIDALTELLAVSALKYQILRQAVGSNIVFDKERALSLEGDSGPYLEYTHARIFSILNKAKALKLKPKPGDPPEHIFEVERILYQFPEVIRRAQAELAPHYLVTYLTHLASSFNSFYGGEKIVDAQDKYAPYKLALSAAVGQTLKKGLQLLGIKVADRM